MSTQLQTLKQSNPNGIVSAPKGSIFTRSGDKFFLVTNGARKDLNVTKKSFAAEYKNEIWYPTIKEEGIIFETTGETWLKVDGSGKTGWAKTTSKTSIAKKFVLPIMGDVIYTCAVYDSTYFLRSNGELWGCGADYSGQLGLGNYDNKVTSSLLLTNVKKVSAHSEGYTAVALTNDGTVWFAGENYDGQFGNGEYGDSGGYWITASFQGDITGSGAIVDIAMGGYFTALKTEDGRVWMSTDYMPNINSSVFIPVAENVKSMYAGGYCFYYIKNDDSLWGFGYNSYDGQLGTGTYDDISYDNPYQIDTNVKFVAGLGYHTLYIKNDNTLWGMGYFRDGQLGINPGNSYDQLTPIQVDTDVIYAGGGSYCSLYVKSNGDLYGMGWNDEAELGIGSLEQRIYTPTLIDTDVTMATGGGEHSLYIKKDKMLWGMGNNEYYALGGPVGNLSLYYSNGNWTADGISGFGVGENSKFISYINGKFFVGGYFGTTGASHAYIAYSEDGKTWTPANINGSGNVVSIAYGNNTYVAVCNLDYWWYSYDQIYTSSDGINWTSVSQHVPNQVRLTSVTFGDGEFAAITDGADGSHVNILTSTDGTNWQIDSGSIVRTGYSNDGNKISYGNNKFVTATAAKDPYNTRDFKFILSFTQSFNGNTVDDVTVCGPMINGADYTIIALKNGNLYACGKGEEYIGQAYYNNLHFQQIPEISNVVSVTGGGSFFTFVKNDGTLWGVGNNVRGVFGLSPEISASAISPILIDTNVSKSFSTAGSLSLLYIKNDGTLWGTGYNWCGELGTSSLGGNITQSVKLDDNVKHASIYNTDVYNGNCTLYLKNDNTLWAMGGNMFGNLCTGDSSPRTTAVQVAFNVLTCAVNGISSFYVTQDGELNSFGYNYYGTLGYSSGGPFVTSSVVSVSDGDGVHALFKCQDGNVYGMGLNVNGQIGNGSKTSFAYPEDPGVRSPSLTNLSNPKKIITTGGATIAIGGDNKIYVTGYDSEIFGFGFLQNSNFYSADGINWNSSSIANYTYNHIAYGNGRYVKVSAPDNWYGRFNSGKYVVSSTDAINWTGSYLTTSSISTYAKSLKFDGSNFVILAYDSSTENYPIYKSVDGISWEPYLSEITTAGTWQDIEYASSKYVIISSAYITLVADPVKIYPKY